MKVKELVVCCDNVLPESKVVIMNPICEYLFSGTCEDMVLYNSSYLDADVWCFGIAHNAIEIMVGGNI